jgi:hypothetical protein
MGREINLDGGEITVIKALGTGGGETSGEELLGKTPSMDAQELIEVLKGLMMMGYIDGDKRSFHNAEELKTTHFHVNTGYSRDLREALDPQPEQKSRRVRRE